MTDKEILEELINQRSWWEERIDECKAKLNEYELELAKVKRLIELIG